MIKLSKKQLSMSLFVLALNTLQSNSFASGPLLLEETEVEFNSFSSVSINTETRTLNFANIFENGDNVGRNDTINILDVDFLDETKFNYLNTILEGGNNLVNLIITSNTRFLNDGVLSMRKDDLPFNLKHLSIKDKVGLVTHIKNNFLSGCENLTYFDSRGLENATKIGDLFLTLCENLTFFNSQGLENVTHLGKYFLSNSYKLTSFDSRGLKKVIQIGAYFLSECYKLTFFDSRGLKNVIKIESGFLSECVKLTFLDTRALENLKYIGDFLFCCNNFKKITTTPAKQWFWKENISNNIKELINKNSIVFLIQNEDQYNDIEERVDYVKEYYTKELSGLIKLNDKGHIQIEIKKGLFPLMM